MLGIGASARRPTSLAALSPPGWASRAYISSCQLFHLSAIGPWRYRDLWALPLVLVILWLLLLSPPHTTGANSAAGPWLLWSMPWGLEGSPSVGPLVDPVLLSLALLRCGWSHARVDFPLGLRGRLSGCGCILGISRLWTAFVDSGTLVVLVWWKKMCVCVCLCVCPF